MKEMLGRKLGMRRLYTDGRNAVAVTMVDTDNCFVVQEKTVANDGYDALQLGIGRRKRATKPLRGHLKKAKLRHVPAMLMEIQGKVPEDFKKGSRLDVGIFKPGDSVDVTGWTKGRGFAGGVKRHGWRGGPRTHGSNQHRRIGSVGQGTSPGHLWKGRSLPGHYGTERQTIRNLEVIKVDADRHLLFLKGSVPGPSGGFLIIRKTGS
ncbi:50S ribosomal protein L3 [candidate division WOR-3 bacterium]|nr:50S ribosomal protein L3 [candidate division WOR-3 bacterium]